MNERPSYWPCILNKEDTVGKHPSTIINVIYQPALIQKGVTIPLSGEKLTLNDLPQNEEEIKKMEENLRYVWVDGYEDAQFRERGKKYLGIRITDDLILHETIWYGWAFDVVEITIRCKARLLTREEVMLVGLLYNKISEMRVEAHDTPLPNQDNVFWIKSDSSLSSDHMFLSGQVLKHRDSEAFAKVLLAVTNK